MSTREQATTDQRLAGTASSAGDGDHGSRLTGVGNPIAVAALLLTVLGFIVCWWAIHHGWFHRDHQWDTIEYSRYAHDILNRGLVPYRDFSVEYPPLALPIFVLPAMIAGQHFTGYMQVFGLMMAFCGLLTGVCSLLILLRRRVGTMRLLAGALLVGLSPLLLGPVLLSRYDLFPVALTMLALTAFVFGYHKTGFVMLALGTAAKAYPAVIVPLAAGYVWRTVGPRQAVRAVLLFIAVLLATLMPFIIIAPHGLWMAIHGQADRPPQIESLAAAAFLAAHQLIGLHLKLYFTHFSDNIDGHPAKDLANLMSLLQLVAIAAVWAFYAIGPATKERLLTASAAVICAFIIFDRVLSPQYLIWLPAIVATLPGRRGAVAMLMVACAMVMTQIWYPEHFVALKEFHWKESWAVVSRDLLLVGLFGTLAWPDPDARRSLLRLRKAALGAFGGQAPLGRRTA